MAASMSAFSRKPKGLASSLNSLSISPSKKPKNSKSPIIDSWEEQAPSSDGEETTSEPSRPCTPSNNENNPPSPPPPTPSSPSHFRKESTDWASFPAAYSANPRSPTSAQASSDLDKRPEKSSAAAGRMIAGALGVKTPKQTEEGKAYERAAREKERKRRERAKEEAGRQEREKEEARKAVWDE